jgi:hypothetical protein
MHLIKLSVDLHLGLKPVTVFEIVCPQDPACGISISAISQTFYLNVQAEFSFVCFRLVRQMQANFFFFWLYSSPFSHLPFRAQWLLYIHKSVLFCYTVCLFVPYDLHNKQLFPCITFNRLVFIVKTYCVV